MQEIIVYRNPVEAAVWDLLSSGNAFPFIVAVFLSLVVTVIIAGIVPKHWSYSRLGYVPLVGTVITFVATLYFML